jgi:hypothetical protein
MDASFESHIYTVEKKAIKVRISDGGLALRTHVERMINPIPFVYSQALLA